MTRMREARTYTLAPTRVRLPSTEAGIGYLAGILDGEGNLSYQQRRATGPRRWQLSVGNTDLRLIAWLAGIGGTTRLQCVAGKWRRTKDFHVWKVCGHRDIRAILEAVYPYLITKRPIAEEFLSEIHPLELGQAPWFSPCLVEPA